MTSFLHSPLKKILSNISFKKILIPRKNSLSPFLKLSFSFFNFSINKLKSSLNYHDRNHSKKVFQFITFCVMPSLNIQFYIRMKAFCDKSWWSFTIAMTGRKVTKSLLETFVGIVTRNCKTRDFIEKVEALWLNKRWRKNLKVF